MKTTSIIALLCVFCAFLSCNGSHKGGERQLRADADSFVTAYFDWRFDKALAWCTDSSAIWLRYAATQVHEADIELLRAQKEGASHTIDELTFINDSTALVAFSVNNFLAMDTIGKAARQVTEANYKLLMKYQNGRWLVSLKSLPQEEKTFH